ncbi:MAG: hypothetical protein NTW42_02655, partial [Deltaproteobacteria bacterium]|nr:hypothetical protein [Deltaproteobacteria bacterium]
LYSAAIRKALAPGIVKGGWVCYDARKEQGAMRPRATKAEWNFHAAKHCPGGHNFSVYSVEVRLR